MIFGREGALYAVGFDPDRLTTKGNPVAIVRGVAGDSTTGVVHFSIAGDGTLAYVPGSTASGARTVAWIDKNGQQTPVNIPSGQLNDPRISPDGSRVALLQGSSNSGDVWIYDFARTTFSRLTFTTTNATPLWSRDGKYIYYASIEPAPGRTTVYRKPADGSSEAEEVTKFDGISYLKAILPDATSAIFDDRMHTNAGDIVKIELRQGAQKVGVVNSPFNEYAAALSSDGRWLAYQSSESGRPEIYVRNLESGSRVQISTAGGEEPNWSSNGRELYYRNGSLLMRVPVTISSTLQSGTAETFFNDAFDLRSNSGETFDVSPRDSRILMIRPPPGDRGSTIKVVLNWFEELRRLAPTR